VIGISTHNRSAEIHARPQLSIGVPAVIWDDLKGFFGGVAAAVRDGETRMRGTAQSFDALG
jgi:hypothetical protein